MGSDNLSTVGSAPVYGYSGSHGLTLVVQPPQTHKPYSPGAYFPRSLASVRRNLPQAQHKLPGLSYLKGAI